MTTEGKPTQAPIEATLELDAVRRGRLVLNGWDVSDHLARVIVSGSVDELTELTITLRNVRINNKAEA